MGELIGTGTLDDAKFIDDLSLHPARFSRGRRNRVDPGVPFPPGRVRKHKMRGSCPPAFADVAGGSPMDRRVVPTRKHGNEGSARKKNLRLCRVDAFENPQFSVGASGPGFGSHYKVGMQAPDTNIGSLRVLHRFVKSDVCSRTLQRSLKLLPASGSNVASRHGRRKCLVQISGEASHFRREGVQHGPAAHAGRMAGDTAVHHLSGRATAVARGANNS